MKTQGSGRDGQGIEKTKVDEVDEVERVKIKLRVDENMRKI